MRPITMRRHQAATTTIFQLPESSSRYRVCPGIARHARISPIDAVDGQTRWRPERQGHTRSHPEHDR